MKGGIILFHLILILRYVVYLRVFENSVEKIFGTKRLLRRKLYNDELHDVYSPDI